MEHNDALAGQMAGPENHGNDQDLNEANNAQETPSMESLLEEGLSLDFPTNDSRHRNPGQHWDEV
jgi:hypothetical protein